MIMANVIKVTPWTREPRSSCQTNIARRFRKMLKKTQKRYIFHFATCSLCSDGEKVTTTSREHVQKHVDCATDQLLGRSHPELSAIYRGAGPGSWPPASLHRIWQTWLWWDHCWLHELQTLSVENWNQCICHRCQEIAAYSKGAELWGCQHQKKSKNPAQKHQTNSPCSL